MFGDHALYELRKVCRYDDKQQYPFKIYTASRTLFRSFAEAYHALGRMVDSRDERPYERIYYYGIYTLALGEEIKSLEREALDAAIYLPDGTLWMRQSAESSPIRNGEVYEFIMGDSVELCIIEDDSGENNTYRHLVLSGEYTHGWSYTSQILPRSIAVSEGYIEALQSKHERYDQTLHDELTPSFGVPYEAESRHNEDLNDYLYIPSSFSGFRYDLLFDCNAAYRKNMHPMWFYLAYPDGDKTVLLPITVSADIKLIDNDYQDIIESNPIAYDLPTFIMLNLQDIMMLADRQSPPEYFLWNMLKVDTITKLMNEGYDRMAL